MTGEGCFFLCFVKDRIVQISSGSPDQSLIKEVSRSPESQNHYATSEYLTCYPSVDDV